MRKAIVVTELRHQYCLRRHTSRTEIILTNPVSGGFLEVPKGSRLINFWVIFGVGVDVRMAVLPIRLDYV